MFKQICEAGQFVWSYTMLTGFKPLDEFRAAAAAALLRQQPGGRDGGQQNLEQQCHYKL